MKFSAILAVISCAFFIIGTEAGPRCNKACTFTLIPTCGTLRRPNGNVIQCTFGNPCTLQNKELKKITLKAYVLLSDKHVAVQHKDYQKYIVLLCHLIVLRFHTQDELKHAIIQRGPASVPMIQINEINEIIAKTIGNFILILNKFNRY